VRPECVDTASVLHRRSTAVFAIGFFAAILVSVSEGSIVRNGRLLAIVDTGVAERLCLVSARGQLRALPLRGHFLDADWNPAGSRFAYSAGQVTGEWLVVTAAADGSKRRVVGGSVNVGEVAWSPDGLKIAFVVAEWNGPETAIVVMRLDRPGAAPKYVFGGSYDRDDWGEYGSPSWSPDSRLLAYDMFVNGHQEVFVAQADGSDRRQLTTKGGYNPSWSPDGTRIAFGAAPEQVARLYTIRPNGTGVIAIADDAGAAEWSPDSRWLAFTRNKGRDLVRVRSTGGAPAVIARSAHPIVDLAWQPAGRDSAAALPTRRCV